MSSNFGPAGLLAAALIGLVGTIGTLIYEHYRQRPHTSGGSRPSGPTNTTDWGNGGDERERRPPQVCGICNIILEDRERYFLHCGHIFHRTCLFNEFKQQQTTTQHGTIYQQNTNTCPVCGRKHVGFFRSLYKGPRNAPASTASTSTASASTASASTASASTASASTASGSTASGSIATASTAAGTPQAAQTTDDTDASATAQRGQRRGPPFAKCGICNTILESRGCVELDCGDIFHRRCIFNEFEQQRATTQQSINECPDCGKSVEGFPLYNEGPSNAPASTASTSTASTSTASASTASASTASGSTASGSIAIASTAAGTPRAAQTTDDTHASATAQRGRRRGDPVCGICGEALELTRMKRLPCRCIFHFWCIDEVFKERGNQRCPVCDKQ